MAGHYLGLTGKLIELLDGDQSFQLLNLQGGVLDPKRPTNRPILISAILKPFFGVQG